MKEEVERGTEEGFIHLLFRGKTTTSWHVGLKRFGDYLYTRTDILWGRGVRGPLLRQLWRTYCPLSDVRDRTPFVPEKDCPRCSMAADCPFNNLRGSPDEGEFKDRPRLIVTNLEFKDEVTPEVLALVARDERFLGVVPGKGPVYVEYIPPGIRFEFEIVMMGEGARFADDVVRAVEVSLRFMGWGGLCNEGFGRGVVEEAVRRSFGEFERDFVEPVAERLEGGDEARLKIVPMLILDRDGGGYYTSITEDREGFRRKLTNCINERYWQFYRDNIYVPVADVSGKARPAEISAWSRKEGCRKTFKGLSGELVLHTERPLKAEEAKAIAVCRYGVGRFKNQGFGSLILM